MDARGLEHRLKSLMATSAAMNKAIGSLDFGQSTFKCASISRSPLCPSNLFKLIRVRETDAE